MPNTLLSTLTLAAALAIAGCGGGAGTSSGPLMDPGRDCAGCHSFAIAGTVFEPSGGGAEGVEVVVAGATLTTNAAGNFFSAAGPGFPAQVEVRRGGAVAAMASPAPDGRCNRCHDGVGQARVAAP